MAMSSSSLPHLFNAAGSVAVPLSALLVAPLLARALAPAGRGTFANDQALLVIAASLLALGVADASTVHWMEWSRRRRSAVVWGNVLVAFAIAGVAVIAISHQRSFPAAEVALLIVGAGALAAASHFRGVALASGTVVTVAIEKWVSSFGRLLLTLVLFGTGNLTVLSALAALVLPQLAGALYLAVASRGLSAPARSFSGRQGVGWAFAGSASGSLLVNLDQLLLLPLIGPAQLGYYAVAVTLAEIFTTAAKPFRDAVMAAPGRPPAILAIRALGLLALGAVACAVGFGWAVPAVFGDQYRAAVPAALVLIVGGVLKALGYVLGAYLIRMRRYRSRLVITTAALLADIGLLLPLAGLGAVGAAVAASVGYAVLAGGTLVVLLRSRHSPEPAMGLERPMRK
jgi:O-antigen/teichoic acid export membrane protein